MTDLIKSYYQPVSVKERQDMRRGQMCWGPGVFLPPKLRTVELDHHDPKNENLNRYKLLPNPPAEVLFNHTPVHELNLASNEELLVFKAKRRLLAVASEVPAAWAPAKGRLAESGLLCLPLYSFHDDDPAEFRNRVQAHEYPWWIYLPEDSKMGIKEGFLRLDRVQLAERSWLDPFHAALSDEVVYLTSEWLRFYLTGTIDPLFVQYRADLLEQIGYTPA